MYIVFSRLKWKPPYTFSVTWPSALHGYLNKKILIVIKQQICSFNNHIQLGSTDDYIFFFFLSNKVLRHHLLWLSGPNILIFDYFDRLGDFSFTKYRCCLDGNI